MRRAACALALTCMSWGTTVHGAQSASTWKLSGYYKNLFTRSQTFIPPEQEFALDLNRLRLQLEGRPTDHLAFDVQYDNELLVGDYLGTQQFAVTREQRPATRFDLEDEYAHGRELLGRHRFYRATATWSAGATDIKVGRQRIAWGTGRFWSPLDILNPLDPLRLEREERSGVDAALVGYKRGPLGRLAVVYAPATSRSSAAAAGYLHGNARGADYSVMAGNFRGDRLLGGDFSARIAAVGIRGELTRTQAEQGRDYTRALLGLDYGWPNTLNLSAELYFNGQGVADSAAYDFLPVLAGRTLNVARRYGAMSASYEITPLLKALGYAVLNLDDDSHVLWPAVTYSVVTNFDLSAGLQHFSGGPHSEYGRLHNLFYVEAQWFF